MRERLLELMPEFDLIENEELREKTLQTWVAAMEESGWTPDTLDEMPFTLLIDPCPASYIEHIRAVTMTAIRAAETFDEIYGDRVPVDRDVLIAGGLLHDIGKLLEYENREDGVTVQTYEGKLLRHPFSGMELAARFGLPPEIQHVIGAHAGEGDKVDRTTEATLVNHADYMSFHSIKRMREKKNLAARMGSE